MPYTNPEHKRANGERYRAINRVALCAKQKERATKQKALDPQAYQENTRERSRKWREAHPEEARRRSRESARRRWQEIKDDPLVKQKNTARVAAYLRANLQYRLGHSLRTRLNSALRKKSHTSSAVRHLGCSLDFLVEHLERQFRLGMTWENWSPDGWHIDHVRPLRSFDLTDPEQYAAACHYTNLQPLWAFDNISKGARH